MDGAYLNVWRKDLEEHLNRYTGNPTEFLNGVYWGLSLLEDEIRKTKDVVNLIRAKYHEKEVSEDVKKTRLIDLSFSVRLINCLKGAGIETLNELLRINAASLLLLPNFGKKTLQELQKYYEENGYTFGNEYLERIHVDNRYVYWLKGKKYKWVL